MTNAERWARHALRRAAVQDAVLATVLIVFSLMALWNPPPFIDFDYRDADVLGVVLTLLACGSVAFRSRYPVASLAVSMLASFLHTQLGYSQGIGGVAPLLPLYSVAVSRPFRVSAGAVTCMLAAIGVLLFVAPFDPTPDDIVANLFVVAVAWMLGRSVRVRRARLVESEQRNRSVLAARDAETRRLLLEERARTAREMQDLVAHNLTEISVQVAAARRAVGHDPHLAEQLLLEVERVGRGALEEMRRAGGILEDAEPVALRPQPDLDDLERLVEEERSAGARVSYTSAGRPEAVSAGVALAAYRVVEEALTQARPRGGAPVEVAVAWAEDRLAVDVALRDGVGLHWGDAEPSGSAEAEWTQLRSRVAAYGGELVVARRRDGRSTVSARFPLDGAAVLSAAPNDPAAHGAAPNDPTRTA